MGFPLMAQNPLIGTCHEKHARHARSLNPKAWILNRSTVQHAIALYSTHTARICTTGLYSTVQYSTVQQGTAQYSTAHSNSHTALMCTTEQCSTAQQNQLVSSTVAEADKEQGWNLTLADSGSA